MNTSTKRRLFLFTVMVLLVMTNVGSVLAGQPVNSVFYRDLFIEERLNCDGFIASEHILDTHRVTDFYDDEGQLIRFTHHQQGFATFAHPQNGKTVTAHTGANFFIDIVNGTTTKTGTFRLFVPGVGTLEQDVGIITYDWALDDYTFEGGDNPFFQGDFTALLEEFICPLLV